MDDRRGAIVMACDAAYLPIALHLAWQVAHSSPVRRFDILIVSEDALQMPDWATAAGIRAHHLPRQDWIDGMPTGHSVRHLPRAAYYRLALADELGGRYRRILYLDCDIFFEGGDLDRLLDLPIGGHPVAAAMDILLVQNPKFQAREYQAMGLSARPYFNSGVLLIDSDAWRGANLLQRCIAFPLTHSDACFLHDQSVLNGVLQGAFAELAHGWNWQASLALPFASFDYPVHFRHFISKGKPWSDRTGAFEERFSRSYRDFFAVVFPEAMAMVADRPGKSLMGLQKFMNHAVVQARRRAVFDAELARFSGPWDVKLHAGGR